MTKELKLLFNGNLLKVLPGTRVEDLLKFNPHQGKLTPVGAYVNKRLVSLSYPLNANAEVCTIDISDREGMDIYRRTACVLLYTALQECYPEAIIKVGQSILSAGYFLEVEGAKVETELLEKVAKKMRELVKQDLPLHIERTSLVDAIEQLKQNNMFDQAKLLNQQRREEVNLLSLKNYLSFLYGPVANRTGIIDKFDLRTYEHALVLCFPGPDGEIEHTIPAQPKLFATYTETKRWNELVKTEYIADLNEHCMNGTISDLIKVTEALHEKKMASIAKQIQEHENLKLILIAGPSCSGKTTFSKRLITHLKVHDIDPVMISMDDYFHAREDTPRHKTGEYNFDCIEALDTNLLNHHLEKLLQGKEINIPIYSFQEGRRHPDKSKKLKLLPNQVLILEGIHGMNEEVSNLVSSDKKFKIFISALTQLCINAHNRIFTTDTRLIRRIVRDRLFRGHTAAQTIEGWPSVRSAEGLYIFPFQEEADVIFNSAHIYEHALLKPYAERFLREVPHDHPSFAEANRLARFFDFFVPILEREVPENSILREFIGGSSFEY